MRRTTLAAACTLALLAAVAFSASANAAVFTSTGGITIPSVGNGNPYPSPIAVSGQTGTVTSVTVSINGLSHQFAADVDLLLVGPSGQTVVLLADTGGNNALNNVNLVFNQSAPGLVPTPILSGTYRPTNNGAFAGPAPAPPAPYGASLAIFNGTVANGTWNLFVHDDLAGGAGSIASWSLDVVTNGPTIGSFAPTTGAAGTQVVITGTNLTGATGVSFAGTPASAFTVVSPTQITATVPAGAASGPITVTTPTGTATSTASFQTTPAPTVTTLAPTSGPVGTAVAITGTNLTGATSVTFGGVPATNVTVASPTQVNATVPPGAGTGTVTVTTPGGSATSATPFTVSHARRVSLSLSRTRARGTVTVSDGFSKCAADVVVRVQRQSRSGGWRTVSSDTTSASGNYSIGNVRRQGRYRAQARATTLSSGDVCNAATSRSARQRR